MFSETEQAPPPRLTREWILRSALRLIDDEGAAALTMRRLAAVLHASPMSLYHHVPSREALLDGLSEVMVAELHIDSNQAWPELLANFMRSIRSVARRHPDAFRLVGMRPLTTPGSLPPIESVVGALMDGGIEPRHAVSTFRAAVAYARGYALAEIEGFTLDPQTSPATSPDADQDRPALPHLDQVLRSAATSDQEAIFEFGVAALIDGLHRAVRLGPGPGRGS
ncbi:MAG TPA: TetR/AcrR family transcriptional regulator C-terminal domain-containing protein [Nocardioidaceae bacterium]|nr:TetR/AcrR family transcriptional regulator C-terminal domain-containing protein [Nocardioidaceae bacterium]